jgi:hypothetical protein
LRREQDGNDVRYSEALANNGEELVLETPLLTFEQLFHPGAAQRVNQADGHVSKRNGHSYGQSLLQNDLNPARPSEHLQANVKQDHERDDFDRAIDHGHNQIIKPGFRSLSPPFQINARQVIDEFGKVKSEEDRSMMQMLPGETRRFVSFNRRIQFKPNVRKTSVEESPPIAGCCFTLRRQARRIR